VKRNETTKPDGVGPRKTVEENLEEYRQFWRRATAELIKAGLITDEHLRSSPRLARAIRNFLRKK